MAQLLQSLSYYQQGVGSNPVRQIGMSVDEMDYFSLELAKAKSDQEKSAIAETMAKTISFSPESDHYQELWPLVKDDLLNIFSRTQIAKALSRTMPAEKKRSVLS